MLCNMMVPCLPRRQRPALYVNSLAQRQIHYRVTHMDLVVHTAQLSHGFLDVSIFCFVCYSFCPGSREAWWMSNWWWHCTAGWVPL